MQLPKAKHRALDPKEVKKLLSINEQRKQQQIPFLTDNLETIAEAYRDNKPTVRIKGKLFHLRRTTFYGGSLYVTPDKEFVPCGYFTYKTLDSELEGLR